MKKQTILITGANRGLGLGLARTFLEQGDRVIAVSRSAAPTLEQAAHEKLEQVQCELTDDSQLRALAKSLQGRTIDVLINNAGMMVKTGFVPGQESVQGFGHFDRGIIATAQHPGWVQTDMGGGGAGADIDVQTSVTGMASVINGLTPADSGKFLSYDGSELPW